ncbi:UDP-N-acetylmuramoyl-tripeptide--D-alanyl-D-alanine ligase [Candidatus Dojkabacteria bacterium]|uniref:UDP-N-acetylmuramoyl-tripeptide--D-alanyl-D-alanine ligase n=1 Tax=Candidatus Dojkabacteria bacterium TaxID=2099670 RepID=A0A955RLA1_9BACT|nr:UDP-N-acetylmuramoyl-tripeptide--D-alanyl-D-alanine ligase [Candidatus Dojkabacteria bacterium]
MIELISLVTIFWTPVVIVLLKKYLWDIYFWQLKEYRWDRFWTHIRWDHSEQNRSYTMITAKFILFSLVSLLFTEPILAAFGIVTSFVLFTFEAFDFVADVINKDVIKPSLKNIRNILIILILLALIILIPAIITTPFIALLDLAEDGISTSNGIIANIYSSAETGVYPDVYVLFGLLTMFALFLDLASPFIVPIGVILTWPLAYIKRALIIKKAEVKLRNRKNPLTIIGITGSQGKSTTKEILYQILKKKYKAERTPENYNTDVGVALSILSEIKEDTEIFIAEMGAYRLGEIGKMVSHFTPDIGIITDIDTQHLGLFGGYANLRIAKSEMVRFMKNDGLAILNGDSTHCRAVAEELNKQTVLVSSEFSNRKVLELMENPKLKHIFADDIKETESKITFVLNDNDVSEKYSLKHAGKHLVNNILICVAASNHLGMTYSEISEVLNDIDLELPRLTYETGDNNTVVLNDSYNSSYKGFVAAVEYMNHLKKNQKLKKRIVITKGIYELGREKKAVYKNLVHELKKHIDVLVTTDPLLAKLARQDNLNVEIFNVKKYQDIIYYFREQVSEGDIVLLEGRLHPEVIKAIVSDKA